MSRSSRSRSFRLAFLLLVIAALIVLIVIQKQRETAPYRAPTGKGISIEVLDGDTFVDSSGQTVRLLGIDTPEKGQPFAHDATDLLSRILSSSGALRYEFGGERIDRYGRLLAFVYLDTIFINRRLIESGLASTYFFEDQISSIQFSQLCSAQKTALRSRVGIWSLAEDKPETLYYGNPRSKRFHRPDCSGVNLDGKSRLITNANREFFLNECYSPCRNCKP